MRPSNKLTETDPPRTKKSVETAIDPFAVDFFGADSGSKSEVLPKQDFVRGKISDKKNVWFRTLPRITNREAEFSAALQNLPESLTEKSAGIINDSIARYTFRSLDKIKCSVISVSEINLRESVNKLRKSPKAFFRLECQPENSSALLAINTAFASSVIDLILGGQGGEYADSLDLSPIESAIIEFLVVNILGEINNYLGEPVFCLQTVGSESDYNFETGERGGEVVFLVEIENFSGILTVLAPRRFLIGLDEAQNPLLVNKSKSKTHENFERIVPELDLFVQIGMTSLDGESVSFLEPDDIVLIEKPEISIEKGLLGDNLKVSVGRGRNFRLSGTAETAEVGGELTFKIREILSEEARRKFTPMKLEMDEKENELREETKTETPEEGIEETVVEDTQEDQVDELSSASLENVQVALRVEIAADKISLRDLKNLRAGQIIALGCRPTDPVRLVTDHTEEPIASGELIEIEGQLGIRLTKVFI